MRMLVSTGARAMQPKRMCAVYVLLHVYQPCFIYLFIYLNLFMYFLAALGLRCYMWAFSSCSERALIFVVVRVLLIAVASLVAEHGL